MKEFSVLMSVYAREQSEHLIAALHSVFEQTVSPTEVVLVEDGPLTTVPIVWLHVWIVMIYHCLIGLKLN